MYYPLVFDTTVFSHRGTLVAESLGIVCQSKLQFISFLPKLNLAFSHFSIHFFYTNTKKLFTSEQGSEGSDEIM